MAAGCVCPARVSDVRVGDRVLAVTPDGARSFDKVFRITHHDTASETLFIQLTTASGATLELSPGHMTHAGTVARERRDHSCSLTHRTRQSCPKIAQFTVSVLTLQSTVPR